MEACLQCRLFADVNNPSADATPGPFRVYEKGAYAGRLKLRIQQRVNFRTLCLVAPVKSFPSAPPTAANKLSIYLGNIICAVINQPAIDAENIYQGALNLLIAVVAPAQSPHRSGNQCLQRLYIIESGLANDYLHGFDMLNQSANLKQTHGVGSEILRRLLHGNTAIPLDGSAQPLFKANGHLIAKALLCGFD
jgi:hypothetical protein